MRLKILGSAAGGGLPQWNCHCRNCQAVRRGQIAPRMQSSLAIAAEHERWVLVNASPDVCQQTAMLPRPRGVAVRWSPVAAVILTDAQIDHTSGLLLMREADSALDLYCTEAVAADLYNAFPVLTMLAAYAGIRRHFLPLDGDSFQVPALGDAIRLTALAVPGKAPPFSPSRGREVFGSNIALALADTRTGRTAIYAPSLAALTPEVASYAARADLLLVDGTCWYDDDLARAGAGGRRARDMGHLPLGGEDGLLALLAAFPKARKVLVHVNNTNPLLDERSAERRLLEKAGIEVANDGLEIEL